MTTPFNPELFVRSQLTRMARQHAEPAKPIMTEEEFGALPPHTQSVLKCNVIGCKRMVSTHGLMCVEHHTGIEDVEQMPKKGEENKPKTFYRFSCTCGGLFNFLQG